MTTTMNTRDPVQGLVDYVLDVKPFHTKILEVWVEYIHTNRINATVSDELDWQIHVDFNRMDGSKYGWDTSPWDVFWNVKDQSEIVTGTFRYTDGNVTKSINKFDAYTLFFEYLTVTWKSRFGNAIPPTTDDTSANNPFRILYLPLTTGPQVITECLKYWETSVLTTVNTASQFWLDTKTKRLYQQRANSWVEQINCYYSRVEPKDAVSGDFWFSTDVKKLYIRSTANGIDYWNAIANVYMGYTAPSISLSGKIPPAYPELWKSNWDYPPQTGPNGENHVYAYVSDLLSFEHGSEIFLFDRVRTAVTDPTGSLSSYDTLSKVAYEGITWRTQVVQTSRSRYTLLREEVGASEDTSAWTIDLNSVDLDGWDSELVRKDVRLGTVLSWNYTSGGTKLVQDTLIDSQTFRMRASAGNLIAQQTDQTSLVDVPCPWKEGTVVYVRSTDDLPSYKIPSSGIATTLKRYTPYKVVLKTGNMFSLALIDPKTFEIDAGAMGVVASLTFTGPGSGRMYIGVGYPIPFMELIERSVPTTNTFSRMLASSTVNETANEIVDIAVNYQGKDGSSYTGFVVEGAYDFIDGKAFQVGKSPDRVNDGSWTAVRSEQYNNKFTKFSSSGVGTPSPKPVWWDTTKLGVWPEPTKKPQKEIDALVALGEYSGYESEYDFSTWTLVAVNDGMPQVTKAPHGFVASTEYNFDRTADSNAANAIITDQVTFSTVRVVSQTDGTTTYEREPWQAADE